MMVDYYANRERAPPAFDPRQPRPRILNPRRKWTKITGGLVQTCLTESGPKNYK